MVSSSSLQGNCFGLRSGSGGYYLDSVLFHSIYFINFKMYCKYLLLLVNIHVLYISVTAVRSPRKWPSI